MEERGAHHQQTARYEALARMEHQRRRCQASAPEPKTIYRLEMEIGRGGTKSKGKQEETGEGHGGQPIGGP